MSKRTSISFSRRALVASLGAGAPLLTGLLGRAHAASLPAKPFRLVLIRDGNGFGTTADRTGLGSLHRLVPPKARNASGVPLQLASLPVAPHSPGAREVAFTSADDLPTSLHPLRRWWRSTMVLDRFWNPHGVDLHGNGAATYTVMPPPAPGMPAPPSLEEVIAQRLSAGLPFPVVRMDHKADTPGNYYQRYLGAIGSSGTARLARRRGVLGAVRAQAARLKGALGREDLQRLDLYLGSLGEAERSLEQLTALQCAAGSPPTIAGNMSKYEPIRPFVSQTNLDTAAAALICGLTRVVSLNFVPGRGPFQFFDPKPNEFNLQGALGAQLISSDTRYADLGTGLRLESTASGDTGDSWMLDRHNNHHSGNHAMLTAIDRWEAALVARLIEKLQAAPEGEGTMWDNTLVVWANYGGGQHHGGPNDHPVILLGGQNVVGAGGGTSGLLRGGRYMSFPRKMRALSDAWVTVSQVLGLELTKFGDPTICQGPLPGARA